MQGGQNSFWCAHSIWLLAPVPSCHKLAGMAAPAPHCLPHLRAMSAGAAETSQAMARAAYRAAVKLSTLGTDVVGIACTAALATDREKRGEHKAFITSYNGTQERR